jgi:hypothetical protein
MSFNLEVHGSICDIHSDHAEPDEPSRSLRSAKFFMAVWITALAICLCFFHRPGT